MKKKIFILTALLSLFMLTGCTKNYKTVDEYSQAMKEVQSKTSYTLTINQQVGTTSTSYISKIKGNKWKLSMSLDGKNSLKDIIYDGTEILQYTPNSKFATIIPGGEDYSLLTGAMLNPAIGLVNWNEELFTYDTKKGTFTNNKDVKNGFDCRLITYSEAGETYCVSDKYGIAVYGEFKNTAGKDSFSNIFNITAIDTTEIPDSEFELPAGMRKMSFDEMMSEFTRNIEKMKQSFDFDNMNMKKYE